MNVYVNELYHHGIKGQKWGVRRYQNEDGTYTNEGRLRRTNEIDKNLKKQRLNDAKRVSRLSDKDLDEKIARLEKERKLKNLTDEVVSPGRAFTKSILSSIGNKVITAAAVGALAYAGKVALQNVDLDTKININFSELASYMFPNPNKKKG